MTSRTVWTDPWTGERHEFERAEEFIEFMKSRIRILDRDNRKAPAIRPDSIEMWNPVDGKIATSKSRYYKQVREAGCYINDKPPQAEEVTARHAAYKPERVGHSIKEAYEQLEAGYRPHPPEEF